MNAIKLLSAALILALLFAYEATACFILVLKEGGKVLVANHEDWFDGNSAIRINPSRHGAYSSVAFTFLNEGWAQGGMNEKGLFFDAAQTPYTEVDFHEKAPPGFFVFEKMLDKCATVAEALEFLAPYQLNELREAHVIIADATGDAVLIGVQNGRMALRHIGASYLLQTNFNPWHPELSDEPVCWRYRKAEEMLKTNSEATIENMVKILSGTHQDSLTIYSNIYDLESKTVYTYRRRDFEQPVIVNLMDLVSARPCVIPIDSLMSGKKDLTNCAEETSTILSGRILGENGNPVPYASIGISRKNIGTLADPDGTFELTVPQQSFNDSILISSIGFENAKHSVAELRKNKKPIILKSNVTLLKEITVTAKKNYQIARLGWMGGRDGILPLDTVQGGGAVALLVESPSAPAFVRKLQVRLMYNSSDTIRLRFHILSYDSASDAPGEELLQKELILTEHKKFGWLRFDLSRLDIRILRKNFFIAFEWLNDRESRTKMIHGLRQWEKWKRQQYDKGNPKVKIIDDPQTGHRNFKYAGNMMDWPGFSRLPPFTGLMVETGKTEKNAALRTFERKTSFGKWTELDSTLNAVIEIAY